MSNRWRRSKANNELQSLREIELQEIAKILFALAEELRGQLPAIQMAANAIAELDFIGAKSAFYHEFNCVVPEINTGTAAVSSASGPRANSTLEFKDARHPLLEEGLRGADGNVVPISFSLNEEKSTMVISGANAGGKTVVLKTAGLLSLMALSGLPVPARRGARALLPFRARGHRRSSIAGREPFDLYFARRQHRAHDRIVRSAGAGAAR